MDATDPTGPQPLVATPIGSFDRIALLADVHGNTAALDAVLAEIRRSDIDAVAFLGCLTWGPDPIGVLDLAAASGLPTFYLRGNGERAVLELAAGDRAAESARDDWMVQAHGPAGLAAVAGFPVALTVTVGQGPDALLCHGSPRSDVELLTPQTPVDRLAAACAGTTAEVVVHGHTHLQYQRRVGDRTIAGCGSVGLPYTDDGTAALWTVLDGDGPQSRRTAYDVERAITAIMTSGYPAAANYCASLRTPPRPADIILDAESKLFSD